MAFASATRSWPRRPAPAARTIPAPRPNAPPRRHPHADPDATPALPGMAPPGIALPDTARWVATPPQVVNRAPHARAIAALVGSPSQVATSDREEFETWLSEPASSCWHWARYSP